MEMSALLWPEGDVKVLLVGSGVQAGKRGCLWS